MASSSSQLPSNRERSNPRLGAAPAVPQTPAAEAARALPNVGSNAQDLARELLAVTFTAKEQSALNAEVIPAVRAKIEQLFKERGKHKKFRV